MKRAGPQTPEIVRVNPLRGRLAYGETVSREDLQGQRCHERLVLFSQRRTRQRSSILFFIGVEEADQAALEALLRDLEIRNGTRGGHVHVVPIPPPEPARRLGGTRRAAGRASSTSVTPRSPSSARVSKGKARRRLT